MIGVWTLNYPPERFIGSEMMTHQLVKALIRSGAEVRAATTGTSNRWEFEGVQVTQDLTGCDVLVTHADMPRVGWVHRIPKQVAVCHNLEAGVLLSMHNNRFALVVCNSDAMRAELEQREPQPYMVVRPPSPPQAGLSRGELVTVVNLNENKVGRFWDIARVLPEQGFLAVLGGYGEQVIPAMVPSNVEVLEHVPQHLMGERVWSRTRLLLAPSERESWNMTASEALAYGIATVTTDHPGVRENLGDTATYVDRDDIDGWVAAIIDAPPPSAKVQGRAQFNHARHETDLTRFVKAVSDLGNDHSEAA